MFWRRQILYPPPPPRKKYATGALPPDRKLRLLPVASVALSAILGGTVALGLSLAVNGPDEEPQPRRSAGVQAPVVRTEMRTAAAPAPIELTPPSLEGIALFVRNTPGVQVTAWPRNLPGAFERPILADSVRLPAGPWVVRATAPGFRPCEWHVSVSPGHPTVVIVTLKHAGHLTGISRGPEAQPENQQAMTPASAS